MCQDRDNSNQKGVAEHHSDLIKIDRSGGEEEKQVNQDQVLRDLLQEVPAGGIRVLQEASKIA